MLRLGLIVAALFVLAIGALAFALPQIARSEAVRSRLQSAAREATGEEVRWEEVAFGLLPPRLVVVKPVMGNVRGAGRTAVEAESIDLRVAVLPLLARTVLIESLAVEGVTVRIVRTRDGFELPLLRKSDAGALEPERPVAPEPAADPAPGFSLAVGRVELTHSRLVLEDRTVQPVLTWELSELEAQARGQALDAPIDLGASGVLTSGGRLRVQGKVQLDGSVDLALTLDKIALEPVSRYLDKEQRVVGALSGTLRVKGAAASPGVIDADLRLDSGAVELADVVLRGSLSVRANLEGGLEHGSGRFDVDATGAEFTYGEALQKPAGRSALMTGSIAITDQGVTLDDVKLRLNNLEATARLRTGKRIRVELDAPPFELEEWATFIPDLAPFHPAGRIALQKLELLATEPPEVRGRVALDEVRLQPPGHEPLTLRGALEGRGTELRSSDLQAVVGGQPIALDVALDDLTGAPHYRVKAGIENGQARPLLTALAGMNDVLDAPLTATVDLSGPLGGAQPALEALAGKVRLEFGRGTLHGVSLLRSSFEQLGTFAEAAILTDSLRGGTRLQRFYGDQFESISGNFHIAEGRARTDDLRLVYRNHTADLRGALGLLDESLDFTGTLTIDREIDTVLVGASSGAGAASAEPEGQAPEQDASPPAGRTRVIPLAHVRGTLRSPRVELTRDVVVSFAANYALDRRREAVQRKLDERLGPGTGRTAVEILEGVLGGRKKESSDEPQ